MSSDVPTPAAANSASSPQVELQALIAQVAALSQLAVSMTQQCIDVQTRLPIVYNAALEAEIAAHIPPPPAWVPGVPRTPDEMDAAHPPGPADYLPHHVVTIGREPGLYTNPNESNDQVNGVPDAHRLKKSTRLEALAYYRHCYMQQAVKKWQPETFTTGAPVSAV
ncbi:hypothetical protein C8R44DRAFT_889517 [Mycena epipterygia]|nr:hypothetical protein C8R44DRAFT_889517 [Mycena epipterygia]